MLQWKGWYGRIALSFSRLETAGSWRITDEAIMSRSGSEGLGMSHDFELFKNTFLWSSDQDLVMNYP
jgi:hypothetical protein